MPQTYGGAPLTLHHYTLWEVAVALGAEAGFRMLDVLPLGIDGKPARRPKTLNAYGWLILSERPA